ncbi:hypothetical protein BGZ93_005484 [Podila epicladia]|nr:hypothetical protein BGZ92_005392 [Podila epicladia]KAG0099880.1 hypothetical protein BGZ93_005484 [Podila epicladia]
MSPPKVAVAVATLSLAYLILNRNHLHQATQPSSPDPDSDSAVNIVFTIPELVQNILQFVPKRVLHNLSLVSRSFRAGVLGLSTCPLRFDERRIPPRERNQFLKVCGSRIKKISLLAVGFSVDGKDDRKLNKRLSKLQQLCPQIKDMELDVACIALEALFARSIEPRIKNLAPTIKSLIFSAKNLNTLTLSFKAEALIFPAEVLVDLAPHAQHISELRFTALDDERYRYGMTATYQSLVSFLEAFPNLSRLAFAQVRFGDGALYTEDEMPNLQSHLHTFPCVTSLDLGVYMLADDGIFQISILFPCLQILTVGIINKRSPPSIPPDVEFAHLQEFNVEYGDYYVTDRVLKRMPRLRSLRMRWVNFDSGRNGDHFHQLMLDTFQAMTDNGVRLEHFVISEPKDSNTIGRAIQPAVQVQTKYMKEIMQVGCFSELQRLELEMALDSFWPAETLESTSTFSFGAVFTEPAMITKLHLGTSVKKQSIRPAVVAELRQLVRMLPCLEDLAIDEWLPDYSFFQGLGQCVINGCTEKGHFHGTLEPEDDQGRWLWSVAEQQRHESERPWLKSLRISFDTLLVIDPFDLQIQVIERFRLLEALSMTSSALADDLTPAFTGRADMVVAIVTAAEFDQGSF